MDYIDYTEILLNSRSSQEYHHMQYIENQFLTQSVRTLQCGRDTFEISEVKPKDMKILREKYGHTGWYFRRKNIPNKDIVECRFDKPFSLFARLKLKFKK